MVILKKIKGATLIETLVASAIILIVFVFAMLSLNSIFFNSIKKDDSRLTNRLKELEYFSIHGKISLPFYEESDLWDISIQESDRGATFNVLNKTSTQQLNYTITNE